LSEIYRVLVPQGRLWLSLHPASYTVFMLRRAFPRFKPSVFQLYAFCNGAWFHCTGTTLRFINGRTEAFQTERGMRIALQRAGFGDLTFHCRPGVVSTILDVEARKA
jgi:hypothetical protein